MNAVFKKFPALANLRVLGIAMFVIIVAASLHRYWLGNFNNYHTFRYSFLNLVQGVDMYILHPAQHEDLFKYSPTFALFMGPLYPLPEVLGLVLWNLLNAMLVFFAVKRLQLSTEKKAMILLFAFIELLSSVQNTQSNGLMSGLMIMAFAFFEEKKPWMAALFICLGFYVKLFALAGAVLFLFYDKKLRFIAAMITWGLLLAVLPVLVTGVDGLIMQYKSWLHLLANDPAHELNFSVMTVVQRWTGLHIADIFYLVPGVVILVLPFIHRKNYDDPHFRILTFASILIWVVIFNHKAESPTFAIAMCGAALWWVSQKRTRLNIALAIFVYVVTGLSATDICPPAFRNAYLWPLGIKAVPCIVLWFYIEYLLISQKYKALVA